MRCSGSLKPKAIRWRSRSLVLVDSMSAFETFSRSACGRSGILAFCDQYNSR